MSNTPSQLLLSSERFGVKHETDKFGIDQTYIEYKHPWDSKFTMRQYFYDDGQYGPVRAEDDKGMYFAQLDETKQVFVPVKASDGTPVITKGWFSGATPSHEQLLSNSESLELNVKFPPPPLEKMETLSAEYFN